MPAPGRRCGCQARRAGPRVPAIPPVERGPVHAELPQRAPCGQIRVLHEADDLAFLRCRQSHVSSPESDATRLFLSMRFSSTVSATTCLSWLFWRRRSWTSVDVASRAVSPNSRFLPASRNSLLQRHRRKNRNLFQCNNLCQASESRPLITSLVLNRMPADRAHRLWTDRDRRPRTRRKMFRRAAVAGRARTIAGSVNDVTSQLRPAGEDVQRPVARDAFHRQRPLLERLRQFLVDELVAELNAGRVMPAEGEVHPTDA